MGEAEQSAPRRRWGLWIALGVLGALGGGILTFWLVYVRAPTPERVCGHLIALTRAEAADSAPKAVDAVVQRIEDRCVEDKERIMWQRDKMEYAKYARCVIAAKSLAKAERC
jgi:hypothetical protein